MSVTSVVTPSITVVYVYGVTPLGSTTVGSGWPTGPCWPPPPAVVVAAVVAALVTAVVTALVTAVVGTAGVAVVGTGGTGGVKVAAGIVCLIIFSQC